MLAVAPIPDGLIIQVNVRLWQKSHKAVCNFKLYCGGPSVFSAAGTPQIKCVSLQVKLTNLLYDRRHGNALSPSGADQCIVHINEYDALFHVPARYLFFFTCRINRRRLAIWPSVRTFFLSLYGFSPSLKTKRTGVPTNLKRLRKKFSR